RARRTYVAGGSGRDAHGTASAAGTRALREEDGITEHGILRSNQTVAREDDAAVRRSLRRSGAPGGRAGAAGAGGGSRDARRARGGAHFRGRRRGGQPTDRGRPPRAPHSWGIIARAGARGD